MARYERAPRTEAGGPPSPDGTTPKVTMRLGEDGTWAAVREPRELVAEQEQRPKPPTADDPRSGLMRDVPPYGAA